MNNAKGKRKSTLLKVGVIGFVLAALCCFTPVLVILLGAVGLSAWIGHLDAVLLPALFGFLVLTVYALLRQGCCKSNQQTDEGE